MKIIFLDIDGVLNGHEWIHIPTAPRINQEPLQVLNYIIAQTGAQIVIASSLAFRACAPSLYSERTACKGSSQTS